VLLYTFVQMLDYLISVISMVVTVYLIMGLLIAFNVINTRNDAVVAIWRGFNALLEPVLGPIRRALPHTGAMDFSPLVLIVGLQLLSQLLRGVAMAGY
jgi:YggT family protein